MSKTLIEQGIAINEQYKKDLAQGKVEQSLEEQIVSLGFENLEDFFNQKRVYDMQQAICGKRYAANPQESLEIFDRLIRAHDAGLISCPIEETMVYEGEGKESYLNVEYCEENGIDIYPYESYGGHIVGVEGDYSLGLVIPSSVDITSTFILQEIKKLLMNHFSNVIIAGNDICIDNKKVCGISVGRTYYNLYMTFFFSFNDVAELAEKICGKPATGKEVGYIDSSVLSMEAWKGEFEQWLQGL